MVWTLDVDDYMATFCNPGTTPLINVLKKGLNLEQVCKMEILVVVSSLVRTLASDSGLCTGMANCTYPDLTKHEPEALCFWPGF